MIATEGNPYDSAHRLGVTPFAPTLGLRRSAMFKAMGEGYVVGPDPEALRRKSVARSQKIKGISCYIAWLMSEQREHLEQAFEGLRQALEVAESALVEYEEAQAGEAGEASVRPESRKGLDLLSIPELCQELGMGKSWVYQRLRSGEIPSLKLGKVIKIRREDLEEYLKHQRYHYSPAGEVEDSSL